MSVITHMINPLAGEANRAAPQHAIITHGTQDIPGVPVHSPPRYPAGVPCPDLHNCASTALCPRPTHSTPHISQQEVHQHESRAATSVAETCATIATQDIAYALLLLGAAAGPPTTPLLAGTTPVGVRMGGGGIGGNVPIGPRPGALGNTAAAEEDEDDGAGDVWSRDPLRSRP